MKNKSFTQTRTELHTHLMGMLSVKGFLKFLQRYTKSIYWPLDEPVTMYTSTISIQEILLNDELFDEAEKMLSVTRTNYKNLDKYYRYRTALLKYALEQHPDYKDNPTVVKADVYNDYINSCLKELVMQGVKYVEISYSAMSIVENFVLADELKDRISCKFLLCTDRHNNLADYRQSSRHLTKLINNNSNIIVGFDIMGFETPMTEAELNDYCVSKNSQSFQRKMEVVIKSLNKVPTSTLRIHAGETEFCAENPENTLKMIENIAYENEIIIPPPSIRLGHALYFNKTPEYLRLLKKFKVAVEINATSNMSLLNIDKYSQLPYSYYLKNDVPVIISTDGHGLYNTTIRKEDAIAFNELTQEEYEKILDNDDDILFNNLD